VIFQLKEEETTEEKESVMGIEEMTVIVRIEQSVENAVSEENVQIEMKKVKHVSL
jgi:hypothetical protein